VGKLAYLRDKAEERSNRASEDSSAYQHDRLIFLAPTEDMNGRLIWKGLTAQALLQKAIKENKKRVAEGKKALKPKEIYESKEEFYDKYDLDFI
jgi:hypothetical protein